MPKTLFIGTDIDSEDNMAQFMDNEGTIARPHLRFNNSKTGLDQLVRAMAAIVAKHDI